MKKLSFKKEIMVLYTRCIELLRSNLGGNIAHFFAHGALHLFLLIVMGVLSFYLYQYSIYDSNPVHKAIQIKVTPPNDIPVSAINMCCCLYPKRTLRAYEYREFLSFDVIYQAMELDSLISHNCYMDNGIRFYPEYNNIVNHSKSRKYKEINGTTNAISHISFQTYGGIIKDAIGYEERDVKEPRCDMLLFKTPTFSIIDSLSEGYISHKQYFDITKENYLAEAIKGDNIFSNEDNPLHYRFFIDIGIKDRNYTDSVKGSIIVYYAGEDSLGIYTDPKEIISIFPEPDIIRLNKICYETPEKIKAVLDNGGLYVFIEDINRRKDIERRTFLCAVLLGAALAFMLDIFVNLIIKWRNLVDR